MYFYVPRCGFIQTISPIRKGTLLTESQFNMELVVQCVRLSSSPLTHHHALLLLGTAATIFPVRTNGCTFPLSALVGS